MSKDNVASARRWFNEVWNERRLDCVADLTNPDGIAHLEGGDVNAIESFQALFDQYISALPDLFVEIEDTVAEGDQVVVRWTTRGTHQGHGFGFAPTGKSIEFRGMTWMRFRDGKIVEGWDSWNQGRLLAELGSSADSQATPVACTEAAG